MHGGVVCVAVLCAWWWCVHGGGVCVAVLRTWRWCVHGGGVVCGWRSVSSVHVVQAHACVIASILAPLP